MVKTHSICIKLSAAEVSELRSEIDRRGLQLRFDFEETGAASGCIEFEFIGKGRVSQGLERNRNLIQIFLQIMRGQDHPDWRVIDGRLADRS